MSSFRVQNARFRILKGGKIGLCLSIALLSSVISPTSLFSADYFTGVQATVTPTTATGTGSGNNYSLTVEQANNVSNTLLNQNVSNTSTLTDDIVFKPTSWATSSYTNPIFAPTYTNAYGTTIPDGFNVNKTIDKPLILNLTLDSFANANNIYKDTSSTLFYQGISQPAGYVVASVSNPTLNLSTNNSTNYTANIIMSGNNTVAGNIDIGSDGNINIIGSNVEFKGNVTAGNTDISNGATLNSLGNITSNINGTTANSGTLNMNGSSQTVTGNIGNTNSLQNFNVTSGTTTLTGNLNATNTNISNGATLNSQGNITSNVNGTTANSGTLNMNGSSQTITGNVGNIKSLQNFNVTNGTTILKGNLTSTNTDISNNSTLKISDGKTITSTIISSDETGNLTLLGNGTMLGTIGNSGNSLSTINAGASGTTSTFNNDIYAKNTNIVGNGTVNLNQDLIGTNLTFNANGIVNSIADISATVVGTAGTINMNGTTQNITGNVGTINNLNIVNGTTTLNGNLNALNTNISSNATLNSLGNITSNVNGTTANSGTLNMNGSSQTITGNVGNTNSLQNFNVTNGTTTLNGNLNATNTNISNGATLNSQGNITSTVNGTTANSGTLNMNGTNQLVTGDIGSINKLSSFVVNSGTTTLTGNLNAANTNISNGATLNSVGNITSNVNGTTANSGTLNMNGSSQTITGNVGNIKSLQNFNVTNGTTILNGNLNAVNTNISNGATLNSVGNITSTVNGTAANSGNLLMSGAIQTISNSIGNIYSLNNFTVKTGVTTANADIKALSTNIANGATLNLKSNIVSNIDGDTPNSGTLSMSGISQTVTGDIGSINKLSSFVVNSGTTTLNGNLSALNTNISSNATLNSFGNINSNVNGTGLNTGTLNMNGVSQTITGDIGNTNSLQNFNINAPLVLVDGNIKALNTNISPNSTLSLSDGKNIDSIINGNSGTLNLIGSSTVNKEIQSLKDLNLNANGSNSLLQGVVNSTNISSTGSGSSTFEDIVTTTNLAVNNGNMTFNEDLNSTNTTIGSGRLNLDKNLVGTTVNFTNNGELNLKDGSNVYLTSITTAVNNGKLNISGNSNISGNIGTTTNKIEEINIQGDSTKIVNLKDDINAIRTTISNSTVNFNQDSGNTATNLVFAGNGVANLYEGITGDINFAGNDAIINIKDEKNINGNISTLANNTGTINFEGDSQVSGTIGDIAFGVKNINVNTNNQQDKDPSGNVLSDSGLFIHRDIYADRINLQNNATLILDDGADITNTNLPDLIVMTTHANNKGNVIFAGTSNIKGQIGENLLSLESITAGEIGSIVTFENKVYVKDLNYKSDGDVILKDELKGNIDFKANQGTLTLSDGVNLNTSNTTFEDANSAKLIFAGDSTINGTLGGNTTGKSTFATIEAGADGKTVTFQNNLYATNLEVTGSNGTVNLNGNFTGDNLNYKADGIVNLADNKAINSDITTTNGNGTLNLGNSTVNGNIGTLSDKLKEVNSGVGKISTLNGNVFANNLNLQDGIINLNGNFTGDNLNYKADGTVNLADNKIVDSMILTTADNQGTLNTIKNAEFKQQIGEDGKKLKEINTSKSGSTTTFQNDVYAQNLNLDEDGIVNLNGNFKGDKIDFKDNTTLNIAADKNITSSIVSQDDNIGQINIARSTIISGDIADSLNKIRAIKLNGRNSNSTFANDTYVKDLDLNEKLTLNLDGNLEANNLNFNKDATVNLADGKNMDAKVNTLNNNEGTLNLLGGSTIVKEVGTDTNRLKEITAGKSGDSTFNDKVYAQKTTINGNGDVNFQENLYSNLAFEGNGVVNIADNKSIISLTQPFVTTVADGIGNLNYEGATTLANDIGSADKRLNSVSFSSDANRDITQELGHNVYAKNTVVGNDSNKVLLDFTDDIKFDGNLNTKNGSTLNIKDKKIAVTDTLNIDKNSTLNFNVQTTDLSSGSAVVGGKSGQITADSLTMENDAKFNITYDGTWEGNGQYNLVVANNDIATPYRATEKDGRIKDNSIIDSTVEVVGKNLVLKADRTTDGSHKAEDLYIVKSGIGNDYSNGASQSLAKLANEKAREGALAKIIRDIEYLEDGKTITSAKKQEMIDIQRKLAPNPSGVVSQNIADASNINKTSIKGRLNEMRTSNIEDSIQAYEGKGLSSGDSYTVGDSTLWLKTTASKTKQDDVGVYEGFNTKSYGFVAGLDKNVGDSSIIGISTSYMDTKATQNSHQTDTNSIGVSLYGSKEFELGYIEGQLNYTQHSSDTSRTANSGDLTSKVKADEMGARIEAGVHIPVDNGAYITPYAGVEYSQVNQKGYTEKGTSYQNDALKVDKYKEDKTTAEVGIKATSRIELDNALIIPQVSFAVAKDFGTSNPEIKAQFVGGGDKFVTPSRKPDDMIYKVGAGVEARITNDTKIRFDLNYDRSKDGDFEGYSGNVTLGISF